MRTIVPFNADWLFLPEQVGSEVPDEDFEQVTLPHTNVIVPHHNFDSAAYAFISTYRKRFVLPEPRAGRRVYLDFDAAMLAATVTINGHTFEEHRGGYTPFSYDITAWLVEGGSNCLTVQLDSTERPDIPPFGNVVDYLTFGGLYRDVWLRLVEPCHIAHVFVTTHDTLGPRPVVGAAVRVTNQADAEAAVRLRLEVFEHAADQGPQTSIAQYETAAQPIAPHSTTVLSERLMLDSPAALWSLDTPTLYTARVTLVQGGQIIDQTQTRFGFREAEFRPDGGFYLNGERIDLIGLDRHQTYPYIGAAAPPRLQRQDAEIVRRELGCTLVRTSHYPQSPYFLDRCDEIGLLVFEEIPGWQHVGDEDWQALSLRDVRAMIERDCNHPAIVLWGVRINESRDYEAFYTATNALAHQLDPTRQTGGVRYFQESQFLEDVFTFNDFSNSVVEPLHTPHLVTEFGGHMFPTKVWDHEERKIEHALLHARIQDRQLGMPRVAGAIGWCAFDYNTHQPFGSSDRVCYHGVMDIFRLPKYAAYFYGSQVAPQARTVLFAATVWAMGDRDASRIKTLVVFSNCDQVDVFVGERCLGRFEPDRAAFPHLPHPPYQIPMGSGNLEWGQRIPDLRVVGYVNGEAVAEHRIDADGLPQALVLAADASELCADGADMTRVSVRIVDRFGNPLPYATQCVQFELDGPADLIGENPFALIGGQAAVYVRARHTAGQVRVRATTARLAPCEVTIRLV